MSDIMKAIPFSDLLHSMLEEYRLHGTVFAVKKLYQTPENLNKGIRLFGQGLELPLGVAAGPHTQLAQNIAACYAGGARFMELKTIQRMYGEELGIPRPCIRAEDEGYNVEWSSEFSPKGAMEEYIKGYFLCKVLARELGFGDPEGFIFNMSCGYNLEGIQDPSVDAFIEGLKDASRTECFRECRQALLAALPQFEHIDQAFIEGISPHISRSLTLSTMHGCPPDEIEKMANWMLEEKGVNLYVKCNPTLLGYDRVRELLDQMGFDYIHFGQAQFDADLKMDQAIPMLTRLMDKAREKNLLFGVKLTNTFQSDITREELPGAAMYMSGRALYPLSLAVAAALSEAFSGRLPISYCGGADANNLRTLLEANLCPVTVCTILLKPRGLNRMADLAQIASMADLPAANLQADALPEGDSLKTDTFALKGLLDALPQDERYKKSAKQRERTDRAEAWQGVRSPVMTCRVLCLSCVDVCPNRANEVLTVAGTRMILHLDRNCNECGNCQFFCVEPCLPYRDRLTLFHDKNMFEDSENKGFCPLGDGQYAWRLEDGEGTANYEELPDFIRQAVDALAGQRPYL